MRLLNKLCLFLCAFLLLTSCQESMIPTPENEDLPKKYSIEEIKSMIESSLQKGEVFYWTKQSTDIIFSAAMHADSFFNIGYTIDPQFDMKSNIHTIDLQSDVWAQAQKELLDLILQEEQKLRGDITLREILPYGEIKNFPQITIYSSNFELIQILREHPKVRFVEPLGFSVTDLSSNERSDSGCDGDPNYNINSADYITIAPTSKYSWNFTNHNISDAWNNSSKGDNTKVCIIDTGASFDQDNLNENFNSGYSTGRTIEKYSTKYSGAWWWKTLDSPDDPCGHGTSMIGNAAAPRSDDGNAVGVAYQSDVMSIRAVEDVIISSSNERNGVRDALFLAGGSDVKVISMSIGSPSYSSTVADGIFYAYNQGKLMMAAAGTSLSWTSWYPVIFPANMSETTAVTGVQSGESLVKCNTCHDGPEVEFVVVMQRNFDTDRTSLALARYSDQPKYVGGSSSATAIAAGIATMAWAESPNSTRQDILDVLIENSSLYPNKSSDLGWGIIDAAGIMNSL